MRVMILAVFSVLAGFLLGVLFMSLTRPSVVSAQAAGAQFGYLHVSSSSDVMMPGGVGVRRAFVDLRTGGEWVCNYSRCIAAGRYPLEQIGR